MRDVGELVFIFADNPTADVLAGKALLLVNRREISCDRLIDGLVGEHHRPTEAHGSPSTVLLARWRKHEDTA